MPSIASGTRTSNRGQLGPDMSLKASGPSMGKDYVDPRSMYNNSQNLEIVLQTFGDQVVLPLAAGG